MPVSLRLEYFMATHQARPKLAEKILHHRGQTQLQYQVIVYSIITR
jgi:hypothetical protein